MSEGGTYALEVLIGFLIAKKKSKKLYSNSVMTHCAEGTV